MTKDPSVSRTQRKFEKIFAKKLFCSVSSFASARNFARFGSFASFRTKSILLGHQHLLFVSNSAGGGS